MSEFLFNFHFLRPLWLLALIPLFVFFRILIKQTVNNNPLNSFISPELLQHLYIGRADQTNSKTPQRFLMVMLVIIIIAMAGPVWEKLPESVYQNESALIIALDLSPSMLAEDTAPSRIKRAHLKIQSLLERRQEGLTALLVYAGEAHIVTPFTDDTKTITNLLPTLTPGLLPIPGSNTEMALSLAKEQLNNSGIKKASLLLVTDGVVATAADAITEQWDTRLSLTLLGVGTDSGGTIPSSDGYLRDSNGELIIAKRNSNALESFAKANNGFYLPLQADNSDIGFIEQVINRDFSSLNDTVSVDESTQFDQWFEFGPTLILLCLPFIAFIFRKGWLLTVVISGSFLLSSYPQQANASLWENLWKNKNQRAYEAWQEENYDQANTLFQDPQWQGSAAYKNNDFESALEAFRNDSSAKGFYNQGNALANLSRFEDAISAYDQALKLDPDFTEAKENKKMIEDLLEQEAQEQEQQNQEQSNQQSSSENEDSNNQSENDGNQTDEQNSTEPEESESTNANENGEPEQPKEQSQQAGDQEEDNQPTDDGAAIALPESLSQEEQQALQQWLRQIPDDPSGLLRRKFEYEFNKRRQLYQQGEWELPQNDAHERL